MFGKFDERSGWNKADEGTNNKPAEAADCDVGKRRCQPLGQESANQWTSERPDVEIIMINTRGRKFIMMKSFRRSTP